MGIENERHERYEVGRVTLDNGDMSAQRRCMVSLSKLVVSMTRDTKQFDTILLDNAPVAYWT